MFSKKVGIFVYIFQNFMKGSIKVKTIIDGAKNLYYKASLHFLQLTFCLKVDDSFTTAVFPFIDITENFFFPNFILQKLRNREKISLALFRSRFEKCKVTEPIDWKTQYPELGLIKWEETVTQYFSDEVVWII